MLKVCIFVNNTKRSADIYKNDMVPVKQILDYLKSIDREMIERKVNDPNLKIELDSDDHNADYFNQRTCTKV